MKLIVGLHNAATTFLQHINRDEIYVDVDVDVGAQCLVVKNNAS